MRLKPIIQQSARQPPVTILPRLSSIGLRELRFVADQNGKVVGFAAIVVDKEELRACYVVPSAARQGVGRALIQKLEHTARERP